MHFTETSKELRFVILGVRNSRHDTRSDEITKLLFHASGKYPSGNLFHIFEFVYHPSSFGVNAKRSLALNRQLPCHLFKKFSNFKHSPRI